MRKFLLVVLLLLAVGAVGYKFFFSGPGMPGGPGMMGGATPVGVAKVEAHSVLVWDEFSGRVSAVERVEIRPRISGTVEAIHFSEGQMVKKGDKLITIDPKPYEAAMQAATARAGFAQSELERAKLLLPEKAISQREFDDKKNAHDIARAEATKAALDLGYTQIKAPIDGRVSRAEITVGNLVNAGQPELLTSIVSLDPIYADFDVDEKSYVAYLAANGNNPQNLIQVPVQLGLAGQSGFPYSGRITSFDNELNTRAGTVRARAQFENKDGALIPGLFARIRVAGSGEQQVVLINERAIGTDQNKKFVMVVKPDNSTERREITLGDMADGLRIVQSGLQPGETIVISGLQRLMMPGQPVEPEMMTMDGAAQVSGAGAQESANPTTAEAPPVPPTSPQDTPAEANPEQPPQQ